MSYYEDQLAQRQKALEDKLAARPGEINAQVQAQRDKLATSDASNQQGLTDILTGVSNRYGLMPGIVQAGQSQYGSTQPIVQRKRESLLSYQKMQNMNNFFNQKYNYALNSYANAGYNMKQSEAFARQWAQQQMQQQFQAGLAQSGRDAAQERSDISAQYQDALAKIKPDQSDPYQEAFIRSITGLIPYAGYAAYQKYKTPAAVPGSTAVPGSSAQTQINSPTNELSLTNGYG